MGSRSTARPMDDPVADPARWASVGYLAAGLLAADHLLQVVLGTEGLDPTVPSWRFRVATLMGGRVAPLGLALVLGWFSGVSAGHRRVVGGLGAGALGLAVLCVLCGAVFWLDGPAVLPLVPGEELLSFRTHWVRGFLVCLVGTPLYAAAGVTLLRRRQPST